VAAMSQPAGSRRIATTQEPSVEAGGRGDALSAHGEVQEAAGALAARERALAAEVQRLRARLSALESELVEVQARTNTAVGEWQERVYWLDRWHIDLNAIMRRPGASELRAAIRALRSVYRLVMRARRALARS
jgi:hypothetical protein